MLNKEYLNTARTLLRVARSMTDQAIADRLKMLAEGYERRAERAQALGPGPGAARVRREMDSTKAPRGRR
jgi:hypothetical protein